MKFRSLALIFLLAACGGGVEETFSDPSLPEGTPPAALAGGLSVDQVALYQNLKVSLMNRNSAAPDALPIVAGRDGFLRVFVSLASDYVQREILVRVVVKNGEETKLLETTTTLTRTSTERDIGSTVNFDIPGDQIKLGTEWGVELREMSGDVEPYAGGAPRWPAQGTTPLDAVDNGESLQVVVIPIKYNADGSGRLPDTSAAQLEALRNKMQALYPVRKVDISIGAELITSTPIQPTGSGWGQLLQAIMRRRLNDGVPTNVYYYGLFRPATSISVFCGGGCVAGLSSLSEDPDDDVVRASIGLGFSGMAVGADTAGTFVHEVGHAHGREHSPCGLGRQPYDLDYPHPDAEIGVWAYNPAKKSLIEPDGRERDMMSYCDPTYVSDYTYKALFERIQYVNKSAFKWVAGAPQRWKSYVFDGSVLSEASEEVELSQPPLGASRMVDRVGPDGQSALVEGRFYPFDHLPGGVLFVPASAADRATLHMR